MTGPRKPKTADKLESLTAPKIRHNPSIHAQAAKQKATRELEKASQYQYCLRINRQDMTKYLHYCKQRELSPYEEIHNFILSELRKDGLK